MTCGCPHRLERANCAVDRLESDETIAEVARTTKTIASNRQIEEPVARCATLELRIILAVEANGFFQIAIQAVYGGYPRYQ